MQYRRNVDRFVGAAIALYATTAWAGSPTGTAFTYQGQLKQNGVPITDTCAFEFSLWENADNPNPAGQVGATLVFDGPNAIDVFDGLFSAPLDFGDGAFNGDDRWLEVAVKCSTSLDYTTLAPRQPVTATPFASYGNHAPWDGLVGVPPDIADGDSDTQLSETQVEDYLTNGPVDLALGTTVNGQSISTGSHTVDTNAATRCNGAEVFLDGNGNCVSVDATGSSLWHLNGSSIYYNAGRVGIGTSSPAAELDIRSSAPNYTSLKIGNASSDGLYTLRVNGSDPTIAGTAGNLELWTDISIGSLHLFTATPTGRIGIKVIDPGETLSVGGCVESTTGGFKFPDGTVQTTAATGGGSPWDTNGPSIYYLPGGVGIGTDSPAARLDITDASSVLTSMSLANTSSGRRMLFQVNGSDLAGEGRSGNFEIWGVVPAGSTNVFTATPGGNVGIGDTTPGEKLTVAGRLESTSGGFVFPDGTIQTTAATSTPSPWSVNGGKIYCNVPVGIGTDDPNTWLAISSDDPYITGVTVSNSSVDRTVLMQVNGSDLAPSGRDGNFEIWTVDSTTSHNVFTATADGRVGIGKTTVGSVHNATALEVAHGSIALDNGYGIFSTNSAGTGTGAGLHMSSRDELYLMAGGRVAMVIDPAYNVGISAPEPACRLDVGGVARVKGDAWPTDGRGMELAYNSTDHRGFIQVYDRGTGAWGDLFLGSGKVGIGRTSPSYPLHIGTNSSNGNGAHVTAGGVWTNGSDRNSKRNIRPIDKQSLLARVLELPVTQWQYKGEPDDVEHVGPMAQDFYAAFKLGDSDKYIGTVDADGVALAAIQGLHELLKEKDAKISAQQDRIAELTVRLDRLEGAIAGLTSHANEAAP